MDKLERDNKYLRTLAERLIEVRKEDEDSSQEKFAKSVKPNADPKEQRVLKEKIMYAELNIKGRKLQIEDLAEIANYLNISLDYLVGLTDKKTTISKKVLADNKQSNTEEDTFTEIMSKEHIDIVNEEIYQLYKSMVYITENSLTSTLEKIKPLIERNSTLSSLYINNIASAHNFISLMLIKDIPIFMINNKQRRTIELGVKALGNILNYNNDKTLPMLYDDIENMKLELEEISDYLLYKLSRRNLEKQLEKSAMKNIQNERYYQTTNEFITEYSKKYELK